MESLGPDLDRLEERLRRLKREYDLFLAGQRRIEPASFREEVAREILRLSRFPFRSTAARFRMSTLAHRFQALDLQIRTLVDRRDSRRREGEPAVPSAAPVVLVDRGALEDPRSIDPNLKALHKLLCASLRSAPFPVETLRTRLLEQARRLVARPGVAGVRFTVVEGEGGPKIRGEVVAAPPAAEGA